jgi:hypothetical protein
MSSEKNPYRFRQAIVTPLIEWHELTTDEQNAFIRLGYKPPPGSILRNNIDVEIPDEPR